MFSRTEHVTLEPMLAQVTLLGALLCALSYDDVLNAKVLDAPGTELFASYQDCDYDHEAPAPTVLCPMKFFDQRAGTSFVLSETKRVKAIAVQFAVRDGLAETMVYVRPLVAQLASGSRTHEEKPEQNGKRWTFAQPGRFVSEVRLRKTNAGQWQVTLVTVRVGSS